MTTVGIFSVLKQNEQRDLQEKIDQALNEYVSKSGGVGGNRPDVKLLLQDNNLVSYPKIL